jgi:hypothetical protein
VAREKKTFRPENIEYKDNLSFLARSPKMLMLGGAQLKTFTEYEIVRHINDFCYEQFVAPTRNPEIRIIAQPDDLHVEASFGGNDILEETSIPGRFVKRGIYFHPSPMKIRWYPKTAESSWPPRRS